MASNELTLKHITVLFTELEDKGFGRNITIDATDDSIRSQIEEWANANDITIRIKDYKTKSGDVVKQCQIKLSKFIRIAGKESAWGENNLGYGAIINMIVSAYEYDNKFGKGKSCSISNIFILEPAKNSKMDSIAE
jgi:hypothetical protein